MFPGSVAEMKIDSLQDNTGKELSIFCDFRIRRRAGYRACLDRSARWPTLRLLRKTKRKGVGADLRVCPRTRAITQDRPYKNPNIHDIRKIRFEMIRKEYL